MIKDFPIRINSISMPFLSTIDESYETIETVNQSEAGTDIVQVNRNKKLTVTFGGTVTGDWAKRFDSLTESPQAYSVQMYDLNTRGYKTRQMRIRDYTKSLVPGSQDLKSVEGVWRLSIKLVEM